MLYDVTLTLCNLYKFFYFLRRRWACFSKESAKDNSLLLCIAVQLCIAILPWIFPCACVFHISTSDRNDLACVAVVGERENGRARRRHARGVGSSLTHRVSPTRAFVLFFTHYFQASATQARNDRAANEKLLPCGTKFGSNFCGFSSDPQK